MIRTQTYVTFDDGKIALSYDWDDATGEVIRARCVNDSTRWGVHVRVWGSGTGAAGRSFSQSYAAGSGTTEVGVPVGQRPAYPVVIEDGEPTVTGWAAQAETV